MDYLIFNVRTWSFSCARIHTMGWAHTDSESAQPFWLGRILTICCCAPDGVRTSDLWISSPTLPTEPLRHPELLLSLARKTNSVMLTCDGLVASGLNRNQERQNKRTQWSAQYNIFNGWTTIHGKTDSSINSPAYSGDKSMNAWVLWTA